MVLHWHIIDELIVLRDFKLGVLAEIHHLFDAVFVCVCTHARACVCSHPPEKLSMLQNVNHM